MIHTYISPLFLKHQKPTDHGIKNSRKVLYADVQDKVYNPNAHPKKKLLAALQFCFDILHGCVSLLEQMQHPGMVIEGREI